MLETIRQWFEGYPVLRKVVVNTKTGLAFDGVVWRQTGRYLVMRDARLLKVGQKAEVLGGEVLVERDNVEFVQVL